MSGSFSGSQPADGILGPDADDRVVDVSGEVILAGLFTR